MTMSRRSFCTVLLSLTFLSFLRFAYFFRNEAELPEPDLEPIYIHPTPRQNRSVGATIVVAVSEGSEMSYYATARNTVECYGALHGYNVSVGFDNRFRECVEKYKDKWFRRHCHALMLMRTEIAEGTWMFFLDADIGVINPNKLIEDLVEPGYDLYFFDQFFNWEYSASTYLVKNNEQGRRFVEEFANWETKHPTTKYYGVDNGALHAYLMNYLVPETGEKGKNMMYDLCLKLWDQSRSFNDLFSAEACTRMVIGERTYFPDHKVKILPKTECWAQDLWQLHSHWAEDNFMMHAVKEKNFHKTTVRKQQAQFSKLRSELLYGLDMSYPVPSPFNGKSACDSIFPVLNDLDVSKCKTNSAIWAMDSRLKIGNDLRNEMLNRMSDRILKKQMESIGNMAEKTLKAMQI